MMDVKLIDIDLLKPSSILGGRIPKPGISNINIAKVHGIDSLPVVKARPGTDGHGYEILSNILTWRIAQNIHVDQIPTVIVNVSDDVAKINIEHDIDKQKDDPIGRAKYLRALIDDEGLSVKDAAWYAELSRTEASHLLRLLKLDESIQVLISESKLSVGHGKALAGLDKNKQKTLAHKILNQHPALSIRKTEAEVRKIKSAHSSLCGKSPDHLKLEQSLTDIVGSPVEIREEAGNKGHGQIAISYQGYQVLDGILERLGYHDQSE